MVTKRIKKVLDKTDVDEKILGVVRDFRREFKKNLATFVTGAFSFVAALVWRDAIKSLIDKLVKTDFVKYFIPPGEEWLLQFYTALIVTVVAVLGMIAVSKFLSSE